MVCFAGKITQEIDNPVYYKREVQVANTLIWRHNLYESPLCPPHVFKYRSVLPHEETAGKLSPKPGKPASCVICVCFSHRIVMVYKETPNKFYLRPNNLCSHLLLLLLFCFVFFFFSRLLVAPLSTLSDFQISVCRGMCQFPTDDLVFTHAQSYKHWKAPLHTLHVCKHSEIHPFIWIQFTPKIWMAVENVNYGICSFLIIVGCSVHSCSTVDCYFFSAFNWSWNSMTYFVWRECILYLRLLRRWPWA